MPCLHHRSDTWGLALRLGAFFMTSAQNCKETFLESANSETWKIMEDWAPKPCNTDQLWGLGLGSCGWNYRLRPLEAASGHHDRSQERVCDSLCYSEASEAIISHLIFANECCAVLDQALAKAKLLAHDPVLLRLGHLHWSNSIQMLLSLLVFFLFG